MSITRIQNNQITDSTIVAYAKIQNGSLTGNLFAPTVTLNSNVTINGNLFLANTGNTITINATNTYINDPLVVFNSGYTGSLSGYDIGVLVNRNLSSLGSYGSVNTFWGWVENDQAFEAFATTDTGTGATSLNNSGWANIKVGNTVIVTDESIGGRLTVTGASTLNTVTGASFQGIIGNASAAAGTFTSITGTSATVNGTLVATTVTAPTIGNIGARITGDGGFLSNIIAANIAGTAATANVSLYDSVTAFTTNQTFYPQFSNIATTGNSLTGVSSSLTYNPSTGTLGATVFSGSGASLTNLPGSAVVGTVTTANVALYEQLTNSTTNATFYVPFFDKATGNASAYTNTSVNVNPSTGTLSASAFVGSGAGLTNLPSSGIIGTITTANVALYEQLTNSTTNGTFYVPFYDKATGNAAAYTNTSVSVNPSTGVLSATTFSGSGASLTSLQATAVAGTVATANVSLYDSVTAFTTNQTFYPQFSNIATTGNSLTGVSSSLTYNPSTGVLSATTFSGTLVATNVTGTVATANVALYEQLTNSTTNATFYVPFFDKATGNAAAYTNTSVNVNPSTSTISALAFAGGTGSFGTLSASGVTQITNGTASTSTGTGALQVTGGAGILGNLWVGGNIYAANIIATVQNQITVSDPLLYLTATGNLGQYDYDIGVYSNYSAPGYRHSGLARSFASNTWIFFSNVFSEPSPTTVNWNDPGLAYDTVKAGSLVLANSTASSSTSTGALVVTGGAGVGGALYAGSVYDNGNRVLTSFSSSGAGNVTVSISNPTSSTVALTATGPGAVTTGSGSLIPVITTDAYGRIASISTAAPQGSAVVGTVATANVALYEQLTNSTTNATFYPAFFDKATGNAAAYTNTSLSFNPSTGVLSATSFNGTVVGTITTANVALYEQLTNSTTNGTFYLPFYDKATGNAAAYTNTTVNVNPSTGTVSATKFLGDGSQLTGLIATNINGTVTTANVSLYDQFTSTTTNATFYPSFFDKITGNGSQWTNSSLTYNPSTGALSATSFNGIGTFSTATTSSTFISGGNVVVTSGVDTTSTTTGALLLTGSGGLSVGGNAYVGNNMYIGASALSQQASFANPTIIAVDSGSNYAQIALKNTNSAGSADFAAYADNGTDAGGWVDVGFAGSAYSDGNYTITKPQDGSLLVRPTNNTYGGNLIIGTSEAGSYNDIVIGSGSFHANAEVARFHGNSSNSGTFVVKLNTTNTAAANTGAFQVWGGESISGNSYIGGGMIVNGSQTSNYDFKVRGTGTTNLLWARPNTTYDTVIVGSTLAAGSIVNGARLYINSTDTMMLPVGTSAQRPTAAGIGTDTTGMFRYNTTINAIEYYGGATPGWQSVTSSFTVIADQQFNGTGAQVNFTLSSGAQTTASCIVSINGVLQIPTLAYSVSGSTLTFTEAPANGDVIDVRMLTTTTTVTNITSLNGYNAFQVDNNGAYVYTGTSSSNLQYTFEPVNGAMVTNSSNVTVVSAGTSVVDNLWANSYSSAEYTITATLSGTNIREISKVHLIHNGGAASAGTATVAVYGQVNTAGNTLVTWAATTSGNIAQLQATTTNANTILRIKRNYQAI